MIAFPDIDPIALQIGPVSVYWYGIAYAVGILLGLRYAIMLSKRFSLNITTAQFDNYLLYFTIGIILGGRLGYILIYDPLRYLENPIEFFKIRNGGMAFHGAVLGIGLTTFIFCRRNKISFLMLADILSIVSPIGIFFGRVANFINGELFGRITSVSWGVVFPSDTEHARHPSQLYEAFFEGIILFIIMYFTSRKIKQTGYNTGVFLVFYSIFRCGCEFFREPDIQIGLIGSAMSMGQILSIPIFVLGLYFIKRSQCQLSQ